MTNKVIWAVAVVVAVGLALWRVLTNAADGREAVLHTLIVLAGAVVIFGTRALIEWYRKRRLAESGGKQSRHAWLFFLVLGPPMAGYGTWLLMEPHSDDAGPRWPFGTTSLAVLLLGVGVGGIVYAFVLRAQRDRSGG